MPRKSPTSGLIAVVFVAAVLRSSLWLRMLPYPSAYVRPDSKDYISLAQNLIRYGDFSQPKFGPRQPETFRTPGYPTFLAAHFLFSKNPRWPAVTQILLDSSTAVLVSLCAAVLAPSSPAWVAGMLYALDPMAAAHSTLILSETLFCFLLALNFYALLRSKASAQAFPSGVSGLCLGLATLVRPISLYLWLPWSAALAWAKWRWRHVALFALMAVMIPGLWCARNYAIFGHFAFTTLPGANFLFYEAPAVKSSLDRSSVPEALRQLNQAFMDENPGPAPDPFEESRLRRKFAIRFLQSHPSHVVRVHIITTAKVVLGPGLDLLIEELFPAQPLDKKDSPVYTLSGQGTVTLLRQRPWLWILLAYTISVSLVAYFLATLGAWAIMRLRGVSFSSIFLTPLIYLLLMSSGGWGYYRFRVPLWPFIVMLAPAGLSFLRARWTKNRSFLVQH